MARGEEGPGATAGGQVQSVAPLVVGVLSIAFGGTLALRSCAPALATSADPAQVGRDESAVQEVRTEVTKSGQVRSHHRAAFRILTREALDLAWISFDYDSRTKVSGLKAWNLKGGNIVHQTGQAEAVETQTSWSHDILFRDHRTLVLFVPRVEVGSIIAYEFQREREPHVLQSLSFFQKHVPVLRSRFELALPAGWGFEHTMLNHPPLEPSGGDQNRWLWQLRESKL